MEQPKDYFAFISYQRKDEEWAERLRSKLEHYRLPSSVRKKDASLPKEIRPIFRDTLELAGGVLAKEIETALQQSKFFIVICSPNSAKSPWVNKEIQTFIDLGREDRIIPFIIDGKPFSDNEDTECFPPALRSLKGEKELLGININELNRDAACIKVVARMFGLKFDTLWQRYEREKKKKNLRVIGLLSLVVLITLGVAGWIWYQNMQLKAKDWNLMTQNARMIAKQVDGLINEHDNDALALMLLEILPTDIEHPDRPLVPEAEAVLRKLLANNDRKINHHNARVNFACYSPDGNVVASVSDDNTLKLWDSKNGRLIKELATLHEQQCHVSFSKDGKYLVSTAEHTVSMWDAYTGKHLRYLDQDMGGYFRMACFSPDGQKVAITKNKYVIIKDAVTTEDLLTLDGGEDFFVHASFSPDGKRLVVSLHKGTINDKIPNQNIQIYDVGTGEPLKTLEGHIDDHVNSSIYSSDGKYIVSASGAGYDFHNVDLTRNTIKLWDAETGELIRTMKGHTEMVTYATFSPDNKQIISSSADGTIKIWDRETGLQRKNIECHHGEYVSSVMFSPDSKSIVSASFDSTIVISQLAAEVYQEIYEDKNDKITSACYSSSDDTFLTVHHDKVKLWDSHSKRLLQTIPCVHTPVAPVFSPDGSKIAMGVDGVLKIWDVKQNKWYNSFSGRYEHIVTFNPSGDELLTTDWNCDLDSAFIWNIKDGTVIRGWEINEFATTYATYNHTGTLLATGYMDFAKIWSVPSGTIKYFNDISFGYTTRSVSSAAFSMDDNFLTIGCTDGSILVWDIEADSITHQTTNAHLDAVTSIAFSPDGKYYLTTSHDSFVKVWDATKHVLVFTIDIKDGETVSASFNSKGNRIMVSTSHHKVFFTDFPPLQQLIDETRERIRDRQLTPEERRKYYLE